MAQAPSHTRGGGDGTGGSSTTPRPRPARGETAPARARAPLPPDPAELAAGCALSDGFRCLHTQLLGLPTTLRALLAVAERRKLPDIVPASASTLLATLAQKLVVVPPLLAEWRSPQSLASAQLLCAQARQLLEGIPFTRQFLRARSRAFHESATAGTTGLPVALIEATLCAIHAAEAQIRTSSHHLVVSHLPMVQLLAHEYRHLGVPAEDVRDLMQDGCLALLTAAEWFDVRAGARFRTYATFWLRQAITRSLRTRRIVVPSRAQQRTARQLTRRARQLEQLFARAVSQDELAVATGVVPQEIAAAFATQLRDVSLDAPFGDGLTLVDVLVASESLTDAPDTNGTSRPTQAPYRRHGRSQR